MWRSIRKSENETMVLFAKEDNASSDKGKGERVLKAHRTLNLARQWHTLLIIMMASHAENLPELLAFDEAPRYLCLAFPFRAVAFADIDTIQPQRDLNQGSDSKESRGLEKAQWESSRLHRQTMATNDGPCTSRLLVVPTV